MYDPLRIERFKFYCQPVLPLVYDESLSYYETLCKIVDYLNILINNENDMADCLNQIGITVNTLKEDVDYLKEELDKVKNGSYVSLYLDSIIKWIDENVQELVAKIVKYVFFVLNDEGYFTACIPFSWNFIEFDTGYNTNDKETYLHLILHY